MTKKLAAFFVIISMLLVVSTHAKGDEAQERYKEGIALFESEKFIEAARAFREAYQLKPAWKLLYNIGQAEAAARRYGLSLDAFESYLVDGGDNIDAERRQSVLKEIEAFRLLVGTVDVKAPTGTELHIDGEYRGTVPFEGVIRVAAGNHQCSLKKDGEVLLEKSLRVSGQTASVISIGNEGNAVGSEGDSVEQGTSGDSSESEKDGDRKPVLMIAGIATGVVGLAGVGVGAVFAVKASKDKENANKAPNRPQFNEHFESFETNRTIWIASMAAGGVFLTSGIVLIALDLVGRKKSKENNEVSAWRPKLKGVGPTHIAFSF